MKNSGDIKIIRKILEHCNNIEGAIKYFGDTEETLEDNVYYKSSVAMFILQIGELTQALSYDFKQKYQEIPWMNIKSMRNIAAHNYDKLDTEIIWETMLSDIPKLSNFCKRILSI